MNLSIILSNFQCKGRYIVPIKMLKRPPRAEDDHEDSLVLL